MFFKEKGKTTTSLHFYFLDFNISDFGPGKDNIEI